MVGMANTPDTAGPQEACAVPDGAARAQTQAQTCGAAHTADNAASGPAPAAGRPVAAERHAASGPSSTVKLVVFAAAAALLVVLACVFGWGERLFGTDALAALQATAAAHPALACLIYLLLSLVGSVALALPGIMFALAAGTLFGAFWGTMLCWLAVTLGTCLSFLIGRFFLKDSLKPKLARNRALNELLFEGVGRRDVYLLAITRLVPVFPYNLQNFAYGITDMRFLPYAVYSALFLLPGTAVYTVAAAGIVDSENRLLNLGLAAVLLAATLVAAWALKRKAGLSS